MKKNTIRNFALLLTLLFTFSSCASLKLGSKSINKYVGEWDYVVEELPVDIDGTLVISNEEGVLKGTLINPMGEMEIGEITIEEGVLKVSFDAEGNFVELEGTFEGDSYNGALYVQGSEFPMKMTKKK
ncbi:MAG: hypothetical protein K8R52_04735 [Bacteroidales bacterium]|nr:hypothetical protein [Bacteroidales bacterium]